MNSSEQDKEKPAEGTSVKRWLDSLTNVNEVSGLLRENRLMVKNNSQFAHRIKRTLLEGKDRETEITKKCQEMFEKLDKCLEEKISELEDKHSSIQEDLEDPHESEEKANECEKSRQNGSKKVITSE